MLREMWGGCICHSKVGVIRNSHPLTPSEGLLFQTVAMDFITKLPKLGKYNTILTITDHDCTKAAVLIPCQETVMAEGVAALDLQWVYPRYGILTKVITNWDMRFTSKFTKGLCDVLQIKQNISMVYHPQMDSQSERTNQFLETYLRFYCKEKQDNWHKWLPLAEFAHNQWLNATTQKAPFDLIMGYTPRLQVEWNLLPLQVPVVEERLGETRRDQIGCYALAGCYA